MTEKKNVNPFIAMANEAKKHKNSGLKQPNTKVPKPTKGFGSPNVIRRSGRGG